jgi:O-antigen ligase
MGGRLVAGLRTGKSMEAMSAGIRGPVAGLARPEPLAGAYFWLLVFFFVYCARPEDWIPGVHVIPMAKVTGVLAALAMLSSLGSSKRGLLSLPREVLYLLALDAYLLVGAPFSPVWRGGAVSVALDFSKALVAVVVTILTVTNLARLRRLIFVQTGSVVLISVASVVKGHGQIRLESILGGMYGNSNDLAFAIAITVPFCFAFMLAGRSIIGKAAWAGGMLVAITALMLTASRAGIITLSVVGVFCLWRFGVRGRRPLLVLTAGLLAVLLFVFEGSTLRQRFAAFSGENVTNEETQKAHGSYEQRWALVKESLDAMKHHPIFGLGAHNFTSFSGTWSEVHVTYLQIAVEGGIPALILFLMYFWRGFVNLRRVRRMPYLEPETRLFADAIYGSLLAYSVGALFAPEAYQFFPLFAVAYTSALLGIVRLPRALTEAPEAAVPKRPWRQIGVCTDTRKAQLAGRTH